MGFTKPDFPDVDPDEFLAKPLMERMRILALNWAENGFGPPRMIHAIYIAKLLLFYALGGVLVATLTSGLPAFGMSRRGGTSRSSTRRPSCGRCCWSSIDVAGSWGPLAGKIKPMTGGFLFWARPGTIRLRPWKWVPFTAGDRRTWFDVALYVAADHQCGCPAGFRRGCTAIPSRWRMPAERLRPGEPGPAGRADRAAGGDRPARQDHLSGAPAASSTCPPWSSSRCCRSST